MKVQLFIVGELNDAEHKEVFDWISSSSRNRRYYFGLQAALRAVEYCRSEKKYNKRRVRSMLDNRIILAGKARKMDHRMLFQDAALPCYGHAPALVLSAGKCH